MVTPAKLKKRCTQLGLAACLLATLTNVQAQAPISQVPTPPSVGMALKHITTQFNAKELKQNATNWKMELNELNSPTNQYPARLIDRLPYRDENNNKVPDSLE